MPRCMNRLSVSLQYHYSLMVELLCIFDYPTLLQTDMVVSVATFVNYIAD